MSEGPLFLVTGGAGFIGSHLVEELVRAGERVRVLDNFLTGRRENLEGLAGRFELIEGDVREPETCRRAVRGASCVLHQAALPSVPRSLREPALSNAINVGGTLNMLAASREAGVKRFVFASSSSVYGDDERLPKREGSEGTPLSPYAVTKAAGEKYCQVFNRTLGLPCVCLRYFNIFGPRQDPSSQYAAVIPLFISACLEGRPPTIFGDGTQSRDFTYVSNVVRANLLACRAEEAPGRVMNIACGGRATVSELVSHIRDILGSREEPVFGPPRPGDVLHSWADLAQAERVLGYRPEVGLREGLERTVRWYKENKGT
ncbi:MAG: SDR family oxidoreductase [Candidatus Aminicenantes bacterium]|nr:SDR family oxidoreductase [Candidatus Aminicenantes bacterium]